MPAYTPCGVHHQVAARTTRMSGRL